MKLISWNINGIRSVLKKGFEDFLTQKDFDFLCLQETRALEDQVPKGIWHPESYHAYWYPAEKKGYSGVSTWSKQKPLAVHYGMGIDEFDSEGRLLTLEFEDYVVINGYYPNGGTGQERLDYKMRFYEAYLKYSNSWVQQGKQVISGGDFNTCHKEIDIARPKQNRKKSGFMPMECEWMDQYLAEGYVDSFRHLHPDQEGAYSWWSNRGGARERNVGWRIDYFYVSEQLAPSIQKAEIWADVLGSDHCPLYLELS